MKIVFDFRNILRIICCVLLWGTWQLCLFFKRQYFQVSLDIYFLVSSQKRRKEGPNCYLDSKITSSLWFSRNMAIFRVTKTPSAGQQCWPESCESGKFLWHVHYWLKNFRMIWKMYGCYTKYPDIMQSDDVESVWMIEKVSGWSRKCLDDLESIPTI